MLNKEDLEATNLNSPLFDSSKYLSSFLKTNSVKSLIQKSLDLQQDVRNYDQDIQTLVFENYNKFIISIDTVKKMKESIVKVDSKMKSLESSMNKINALTSKIDDSLKTRRNEIQKLDIVNKDLQKLKSLCDFPEIIKKDLATYRNQTVLNKIDFEGIFGESINYYRNCFEMLANLRNEPLIRPIYFDSINEVEEMRKIIWSLQNSRDLKENELRHITQKLVIIIEDKETVIKNYLKIVKDRLIYNTKRILDSHSTAKDNTFLQKDELISVFLEEKRYDVSIEEFEHFIVKTENDLILKEVDKEGTCLWVISKLSSHIFSDFKQEIDFIYLIILPILDENENNGKELVEKIEVILKDIIMTVLSSISEKLAFIKLSNKQVHESFKKINSELKILVDKHINKSMKIEILDRFSENVEHVFRGQLFDSFSNLRCKFIQLILSLKSNPKKIDFEFKEEIEFENFKKEIFSSLNLFKNKLQCLIAGSLIELKSFILNDSFLKSHVMFFSLMHSQFTEFIKLIVKLMVIKANKFSLEMINDINNCLVSKYASSANNQLLDEIYNLKKNREDSSYFLIINQFLIMFEKKLLSKYFEILFDLFHKAPPNDLNLKQNYQSLRMNIENNEIPKIVMSIKSEITKNLLNYSEYYYENILLLLKQYFKIGKIIAMTCEPTEISSEIDRITSILKKIISELSILFPDLKRGFVKKSNFIKFKSTIDIDMERMLAKKSHHFEKSELNRNSVLLSILKSVLKGIIEHIRKCRFNKFGFQQIELDLFFLIQIFFEMVAVDDESLMIGFYYEMIENASQNCFDPTHLNQTVLENIVNNERTRIKI